MNIANSSQVMRGTALKASYGRVPYLERFKYNKVVKLYLKKSSQAKKDSRLVKAGYNQKGKFGFIKVSPKQSTKKSKRSTKRGSKKRGSQKR